MAGNKGAVLFRMSYQSTAFWFQFKKIELRWLNCGLHLRDHVIPAKKLNHLKGIASVERQMYYNNNTAQHSLLREQIIENKRN